MIRWVTAARRRLRGNGDEAGFVLPYVMLITFLVMTGTAAMLGSVANNSVPARHSQDSETALAAAQAGIQAYVAELNANCSSYYTVTSSYSIQECSWPSSAAASPLTSGSNGAPALTTGTYSVQASNTIGFLNANDDDLRILSNGTANGTTVKLIADIAGTPNALRFSYFTDHESIDPRFLASYFPARTVSVPGSSLLTLLGFSVGQSSATVTWGGLTAASAANCGAVWYNDTGNPTVGGIGRSGAGDDVVETGTMSPSVSGVSPSIDHVCSVDFTAGMNFNGPVYSHDALYVSNGVPGNLTGPNFSVPTACGGATLTNCEPLPPASSAWSSSDTPGAPASPYRSVAAPLNGTPTSNNTSVQTVQTSKFDVTLPGTDSDAAALAACSYTGNVTITISGSTATVSGAGATGQSAACLSVSVSKTTLYVGGDATIAAGGNLSSGRLSIVSSGDIVLKGSLTTSAAAPASLPTNSNGEPSVSGSTPAIDLVALNNVRIAHDVTCADGSTPSATTGYCPNDITGLYTTDHGAEVVNSDGTLKTTHPARQYCNSSGEKYPCSGSKSTCESGSGGLTVTAAIFAITGSLQTDNYSRGCPLGTLTVNGGIYTNFRGPLGQEWEVPSSGATTRSFSGYKLQLKYVNLESAGLQYVPALEGGTVNHPWGVISVSGGVVVTAGLALVAPVAALGVGAGSSLNAMIRRLPRSEPVPATIERTAWSARSPMVEIGTGLLFAAVTVRFGWTLELPAYLYLALIGVTLAVLDLDVRRLPDVIVLPSYIISVLLLMPAGAAHADWSGGERAIAGMIALLALFFALALAYPNGLGMGDVKLAGLVGMYLGWLSWNALFLTAIGSILIAAVVGSFAVVTKHATRNLAVPIGPCLITAAVLALFVAAPVSTWYGSLMTA